LNHDRPVTDSLIRDSTDWDRRLYELARYVGQWSKDRSTKVGCVISTPDRQIVSIGYNGFPRGIDDGQDARHSSPTKYLWTEHAERNAIYGAARLGIATNGCEMFLSWFPCMDCARAIVQAGISRLVAIQPDALDPKWGQQFVAARELLEEARVTISLLADSR
jgi:dCMP deaminase